MTERTFRVERNGILLFQTNLNPQDGVFLSQAADDYIASLGVQAHPDIQVETAMIPTPLVDALIEEIDAEYEALDYSEWTVEEIKDALRARDLLLTGNKAELIERLEDDDEG
jgi:hypothetical protein